MRTRDFPGGPVVKIWPSNGGNTGSIPGQGAQIPHGSQSKKTKHENNRSNIVPNSIKTLKVVHIKKKKELRTSEKRWRSF